MTTLRMFDADNAWIVHIHAQFQQYAEVQRRVSWHADPLEVPTRQMLAEVLDVAFWASLITNEGRPTRVRLAMVRSGSVEAVQAFKHPLPFTEDEVARLAPASWATGWLAVDVSRHPAGIWGISRSPSPDRMGAITIDVSDPGVIRVGLEPLQSFVVFDRRATASPDGARDLSLSARLETALRKHLADEADGDATLARRECTALSMLARMVLEDRHGGTLLVVPNTGGAWKDSLNPFTHEFLHPDNTVRDSITTHHTRAANLALLERADVSQDTRRLLSAAFSQVGWHPEDALRPVARLAAVDGAVVLTSDLGVLGFGAMIDVGAVPDVYVSQSWPDAVTRIQIDAAGGARHQSALRFAGAHHDAIALVASHDGHLALAHWSSEYDGVLMLKNAEWWI